MKTNRARKPLSVFINCPFTEDYDKFFKAIVFTIVRCGFVARCAREIDDSSENRFDKIVKIISQCDLAIHDISKTELDTASSLPRFNMPLELGLFLGAKKFGNPKQKRKLCIIFDRAKYRYQTFISDIAGQDIHSHENNIKTLVKEFATWLRAHLHGRIIPGGAKIADEFDDFMKSGLPLWQKHFQLTDDEVDFIEFSKIAALWLARIEPSSA